MPRGKIFIGVLFWIVSLAVFSPFASADIKYTVTDLGTLPGGVGSVAYGINGGGQVVGYGVDIHTDHNALLWTNTGGIQDLVGVNSEATAINNRGEFVGKCVNKSDGEYHAFLWTSIGGTQDLGTLPGLIVSQANAINNTGQVVGLYQNATNSRAFLYTSATGMRDLGTLGGATAVARGINDSGQIVGYSDTSTGGQRAFLYTPGIGMQDLGVLRLNDNGSGATAINNNGQIVGSSTGRAFLYTAATGMQGLGLFPGALSAIPAAINNSGQVVGYSEIHIDNTYMYRAFFYSSDTGMVDLNTLIDSSLNWTLQKATGINDLGQIVGYGTNSSGATEAFVLTPIPEPATLSILAMGGLALLRRK
jgi:probable HAF family extracellular repeat protein